MTQWFGPFAPPGVAGADDKGAEGFQGLSCEVCGAPATNPVVDMECVGTDDEGQAVVEVSERHNYCQVHARATRMTQKPEPSVEDLERMRGELDEQIRKRKENHGQDV